MKVFSGSASVEFGGKIAQAVGISSFPVEEHVFPDGERRIRITQDVVGEQVVVVQSACPPVDSNYMELFFMIDGLKRSGAEFVTAVVPYFGYQRQDHVFRDGEAVSLEVVIRILESLGVSRLVSVDMHSVKIPDLFTIPVEHLSAIPLFASVIASEAKQSHTNSTLLVSPDMGGIARIEKLSQELNGMDFVALEKNRDLQTGEITIERVKDGSLTGKKRAIMVDDMISSGNTMVKGATFLQKQGIEEIFVFATHAIFSSDAPLLLQNSVIKKVYVTDTVPVPQQKQFPKLEILSVAPLIAKAL